METTCDNPQQSKDYEAMQFEKLICILIIHEQVLQGDNNKVKGRNLALKTSHQSKKIESSKALENTNNSSRWLSVWWRGPCIYNTKIQENMEKQKELVKG